jgi:hypothetical protein
MERQVELIARELLWDATLGRNTYGLDLASLEHYFFHFAMALDPIGKQFILRNS